MNIDNINRNNWYAVFYLGDMASGTSDEWQLWHGSHLIASELSGDSRIMQYVELSNGHQYAQLPA